jgi:hypothetical protein
MKLAKIDRAVTFSVRHKSQDDRTIFPLKGYSVPFFR